MTTQVVKRAMHSNWMLAASVATFAAWLWLLWPGQSLDCPYRVSSSGLIHGPDSKYWPMTSKTYCFDSMEAARAALGDE